MNPPRPREKPFLPVRISENRGTASCPMPVPGLIPTFVQRVESLHSWRGAAGKAKDGKIGGMTAKLVVSCLLPVATAAAQAPHG